jgi:hypothetical protein
MSHGSMQEQQLKAEEYDLGFPRRRAGRASCSEWGSRWDGGLVLLTTPIFDLSGYEHLLYLSSAAGPHARAIVPERARCWGTGKRAD